MPFSLEHQPLGNGQEAAPRGLSCDDTSPRASDETGIDPDPDTHRNVVPLELSLKLPRHVDPAAGAFQRSSVPIGKPGSCVVGAVEKAQKCLLGIGRIPDDAIGQQKLSRLRIKKCLTRDDRLR